MKSIHSSLLGAGLLLVGAGQAQAQDHHGHTMCDPTAAPEPVLSVADFDGDGVVDGGDIDELSNRKNSGEYTAFFDFNADGVLDSKDVTAAAQTLGQESTLLDQQVATVFWATERYRDINNAYADGFRPYTPVFEGHGKHLTRMPVLVTVLEDGSIGLDPDYENVQDEVLDLAVPEGLNYDENNNLIAVYFHHSIDAGALTRTYLYYLQLLGAGQYEAADAVYQQITAMQSQAIFVAWQSAITGGAEPYLFDSDEAKWHQHWGSCFDELDYVTKSFDPTFLGDYSENALQAECFARPQQTRAGWIGAYNMLHVWLYKLNPCGLFAGEHPEAATDYPIPADTLYRSTEEWWGEMGLEAAGLPYPYMSMGH